MIRVLVNGALGRMGSEVCKKVWSEADLELAAVVDAKEGTVTLGDTVFGIETDLEHAIEASKPDVVVDFTRPDVVMNNLRKVLALGVHAVVGTTGFSYADLKEVDELARKNNTSLLIAPNFALGAVVMMKLACEAAKYFPHVEIIENIMIINWMLPAAPLLSLHKKLLKYVRLCVKVTWMNVKPWPVLEVLILKA